jgi:hypothetical protein
VAGHQTGLNVRRRLLHKIWQRRGKLWGRPNDEYIRTLHCDPESLKRAVEFFGLNKDMELNPAVKSDVFLLAVLLAEELFGKRKRGPKSGNNLSWDDAERFLELGFLYEELKSDCPQSSDTEIAAIIVKNTESRLESNVSLCAKIALRPQNQE